MGDSVGERHVDLVRPDAVGVDIAQDDLGAMVVVEAGDQHVAGRGGEDVL